MKRCLREPPASELRSMARGAARGPKHTSRSHRSCDRWRERGWLRSLARALMCSATIESSTPIDHRRQRRMAAARSRSLQLPSQPDEFGRHPERDERRRSEMHRGVDPACRSRQHHDALCFGEPALTARVLCGSRGRTRTDTPLRAPDFESGASASSATRPAARRTIHTFSARATAFQGANSTATGRAMMPAPTPRSSRSAIARRPSGP